MKAIFSKDFLTVGFLKHTSSIDTSNFNLAHKYLTKIIKGKNEYEVSVSPFYIQGRYFEILAALDKLSDIKLTIPDAFGDIEIWVKEYSELPKANPDIFASAVIDGLGEIAKNYATSSLSTVLGPFIEKILDHSLTFMGNEISSGDLVIKVLSHGEINTSNIGEDHNRSITSEIKNFITKKVEESRLGKKYIVQIGSNLKKVGRAGYFYNTHSKKLDVSLLPIFFKYLSQNKEIPFGLFYDLPYIDD